MLGYAVMLFTTQYTHYQNQLRSSEMLVASAVSLPSLAA